MFYDEEVVNIRSSSITAPVQQTVKINDLFIRKIISFMKEGFEILDIGTGNGFVLKTIRDNTNIKCTLTGIDNSKSMVKAAKDNLGDVANIVEGDNENLPFEDNSFNIITAKNVTQFNANELFRVLKEDGYFFFREYGPNKGLTEIAELFRDRLIRSRNINYYSKKLEDSGFSITSIKSYLIKRKYQSVQEIINITRSFPFISDYSEEDEKIIKDVLNGSTEITSDPFILIAHKDRKAR